MVRVMDCKFHWELVCAGGVCECICFCVCVRTDVYLNIFVCKFDIFDNYVLHVNTLDLIIWKYGLPASCNMPLQQLSDTDKNKVIGKWKVKTKRKINNYEVISYLINSITRLTMSILYVCHKVLFMLPLQAEGSSFAEAT